MIGRKRAVFGPPLLLALSLVACAGKSEGQDNSSESGGSGGAATSGSSGSTNSAGSTKSAGGSSGRATSDGGMAAIQGNPPPQSGGVAGHPPPDDGGDHLADPDEQSENEQDLEDAHQNSEPCVSACNVLNQACNGSGFNDCDLSCPGRLAEDAECSALVEQAYTCLADSVADAIICADGRDPAVRCGPCDDALAALASSCDLVVQCQF